MHALHRTARRTTRLLIPTALGAFLLALSCRTPDTIVKVTVTGNVPALRQLHVTATVGGESKAFDVPDTARAIVLPTNFTIELRRALTGRLDVLIEGRDGSGATLASGAGFVDNLEAGAVYSLVVDLGGVTSDGGTDTIGMDATGTDTSTDTSMDAGMDAGVDAGTDLGTTDGGAPDGPEDAGELDSGEMDTGAPDEPFDAGDSGAADEPADMGDMDTVDMDVVVDMSVDSGDAGSDAAGETAGD